MLSPETVRSAIPWGIDNDYARLRDVLLGRPIYYRWVEAGPIIARTLANQAMTGARFCLDTALAQHAEMVALYESAGVACHYLEADEVLHRNFFARDSSAMTPWGALICHMQLKCRRADYVSAIHFYQEHHIPDLAIRHRRAFRRRRSGHPRAGQRADRLLRRTFREGRRRASSGLRSARELGGTGGADLAGVRSFGWHAGATRREVSRCLLCRARAVGGEVAYRSRL